MEPNPEKRKEPARLPRRGFVDAEALIRAASREDDDFFIERAGLASISWSPASVTGRSSGRHYPIYHAAETGSETPTLPE